MPFCLIPSQAYYPGIQGIAYVTVACVIFYVIAFAVGLGNYFRFIIDIILDQSISLEVNVASYNKSVHSDLYILCSNKNIELNWRRGLISLILQFHSFPNCEPLSPWKHQLTVCMLTLPYS